MSFRKQILIGIIIMCLGFTLSIISNINWFSNLGVCILGLMFVINPVEPEKYKDYPNLTRWIRITGIIIIVIGAITRFNW